MIKTIFDLVTLFLLAVSILFVSICLKSGRIGQTILYVLGHLGGFIAIVFVVVVGAIMATSALAVALAFILKWSVVLIITAIFTLAIKILLHSKK